MKCNGRRLRESSALSSRPLLTPLLSFIPFHECSSRCGLNASSCCDCNPTVNAVNGHVLTASCSAAVTDSRVGKVPSVCIFARDGARLFGVSHRPGVGCNFEGI